MWTPERIEPGPGQESVWDYPRPPRLERTDSRIEVMFNGVSLADSVQAYRVLETSQPPVYYLPPADVATDHLKPTTTRTFCEWKGLAAYVTVAVNDRTAQDGAWFYPDPTAAFTSIAGYYAFYAQRMDRCSVDGEVVEPNEGAFYGGWITASVVGPFKGGAGSAGW